MAECCRSDCSAKARWQVRFKLWALATAPDRRTDRNCINAITSLVVCDDHRSSVDKDYMMTPEGRVRITSVLDRLGLAMPDYSSLQIELEEIVDEPVDVRKMARDGDAVEG